MPKRPSGLELRGAKWRTRLSVPEALRKVIGARELVVSHQTSDYQTALELHEIKIIEFRNQIRAARRKFGNESWLSELREGEIRTILYEWMHKLENASLTRFQQFVDSEDEDQLEDLLYTLNGDLENLSHDLKSHRTNPNRNRKLQVAQSLGARPSLEPNSSASEVEMPTVSEEEANKLLEKNGVNYDTSSVEYRRFQKLVARGMAESLQRRLKELGGYIHSDATDDFFRSITGDPSDLEKFTPERIKAKHTISALVESKLEEKSHLSDDTKGRYRKSARVFEGFMGSGSDLSNINREHFIEFKNILMQSPRNHLKFKGLSLRQMVKLPTEEKEPLMKSQTVRQYLNDLSMF